VKFTLYFHMFNPWQH